VCLLVAPASAVVAAQTRGGEPPTPATRTAPQSGATADEDFELNIDVRRINERDFQAETAVEVGGAGAGLRLKVGVALGAQDIDVLLQGVRGRVRFRASLAPVLRLLDARRGAPAPAQSPPPSP
jgi:5-enolpyruvylshikimate-3-phosphate synthase